jgi:hypothetical protein
VSLTSGVDEADGARSFGPPPELGQVSKQRVCLDTMGPMHERNDAFTVPIKDFDWQISAHMEILVVRAPVARVVEEPYCRVTSNTPPASDVSFPCRPPANAGDRGDLGWGHLIGGHRLKDR